MGSSPPEIAGSFRSFFFSAVRRASDKTGSSTGEISRVFFHFFFSRQFSSCVLGIEPGRREKDTLSFSFQSLLPFVARRQDSPFLSRESGASVFALFPIAPPPLQRSRKRKLFFFGCPRLLCPSPFLFSVPAAHFFAAPRRARSFSLPSSPFFLSPLGRIGTSPTKTFDDPGPAPAGRAFPPASSATL